MIQSIALTLLLMGFSLAGFQPASSQTSKKLEERTKGMEQGQQKSWQQVDEINKETDKTKTRYRQAQKGTAQSSQTSGYAVKKTKIGTGGAYQKPAPTQRKTGPKKK